MPNNWLSTALAQLKSEQGRWLAQNIDWEAVRCVVRKRVKEWPAADDIVVDLILEMKV